jgi:hypothetical protein
VEYRYPARECHGYGRWLLFHTGPLFSTCRRAAERPAVIFVLARCTDGLRWLFAVLAGNTPRLKKDAGWSLKTKSGYIIVTLMDIYCSFCLCFMFYFV